MKIRLILFDFGGVIAPEGFQLGILKLAMKFGKPFREMYEIAGYKAALDSGYTAGKAAEEDYWRIIAENLGIDEDLSGFKYLYLDNFQPRADMIDIIRQLSAHYELGIFSDQTNWIHELENKYEFMKYFDYRFISYDLGYTKHDREFYSIPAESTGIAPEKILVVDDKQRVLDNCASAGMNCYLFTSVKACGDYLLNLPGAE